MEILTYREFEQKETLLPLMEQAFGWPFDPAEFEKDVKADPRLRDGCIGFCALREGKAIGYTGVMDLTLRASSGAVEKVGGLYGVATLPGYTRQGICTALMNRAHEYFVARGYHFSLLTTSPTIVAHSLYAKMGYFNVAPFLSAYKTKKKGERHESPQREGVSTWDFNRMLELFRAYVKGRTGFVVRDETHMKRLMKQYEISARECIMTQRGYVIFKKEKKLARVRELVAKDQREMCRLLGAVEDKARSIVIGRLGLWDPVIGQAYVSRGFTILKAGHGVLMAKELSSRARFNETYGNGFYMGALDHF